MMGDIGRAYSEAIGGALIFAFVAGAVTATLLIFGVPWLWGLLKPLLHAATA